MAPKQPERLKHVAEKATSNNPSQLGDPISVKAEVSETVPTEGEEGSRSDSSSGSGSDSDLGTNTSDRKEPRPGKQGQPTDPSIEAKNTDGEEVKGRKPLRLKELAEEKLEGKGGNPSQLGDPISLKAETNETEPPQGTKGADGQRQGDTQAGAAKSKL